MILCKTCFSKSILTKGLIINMMIMIYVIIYMLFRYGSPSLNSPIPKRLHFLHPMYSSIVLWMCVELKVRLIKFKMIISYH